MQLTRRDLLAAGALGALTACTSPTPPEPLPVDPDLALVAAALTREQALLTAYDAALADHPELTGLLAPLRAEHLQHLQRLQPSASPTASSPPPTAPAPLPLDRATARRRALATLERSTSIAHGGAALTASRRIAPLLASLSASEASHVVVL